MIPWDPPRGTWGLYLRIPSVEYFPNVLFWTSWAPWASPTFKCSEILQKTLKISKGVCGPLIVKSQHNRNELVTRPGMLDAGSLVESTPSFRRAPSSLSYSSRNFLEMPLKDLIFKEAFFNHPVWAGDKSSSVGFENAVFKVIALT